MESRIGLARFAWQGAQSDGKWNGSADWIKPSTHIEIRRNALGKCRHRESQAPRSSVSYCHLSRSSNQPTFGWREPRLTVCCLNRQFMGNTPLISKLGGWGSGKATSPATERCGRSISSVFYRQKKSDVLFLAKKCGESVAVLNLSQRVRCGVSCQLKTEKAGDRCGRKEEREG